MNTSHVRRVAAPLLAGSLAFGALAAPAEAAPVAWTAAWGASPQLPSTGFTPNWSQEGFSHQSVRQVVRVTKGGSLARIRLSNAYGTSPLRITGAVIARTSQGAAVEKGSVRHLTFNGERSTWIPAHGELRSDAAELGLESLESVTVTLYFAGTTGPATFHSQGWADTYRAEGDHRADTAGTAYTGSTQSWYYLSAVEVGGAANAHPTGAARKYARGTGDGSGVAVFGDSITDGFGSTPNTDRRYSDSLAELTGRPVVNQGIGGNLALNDSAWFGERATARFGRDVLDQPGISTVVVLEGLNDIGFSEAAKGPNPPATYKPAPVVSSRQLIGAYRTLIDAAHEKGLEVIGATLLPFKGSDHWGPHAAQVSNEVNDWIRHSGEFDAYVDFDRALASPSDPDRLDAAYAYKDALHPNDAGYRAMANEVADVLER
ncbi:SGNH/GDSL hydrolase family protein [Streptomyces sp. QL37]|uniref:SGNH/GDSL hydrolase family protein n=1 Tax=Streptomyces sp. QL37 TaxID=2093747 RepID=UPI000CF2B98A|nr:SGNH/GDSL hydrolase family protein [Streptomyces sp. QL37]PPQ61859.1 G-D-S-L family lipolytic protein [Streptomyces sp. QL37]